MAKTCKMRNVSTTSQAKFQTTDGNVTIAQFKRGLWSVLQRGFEPFMVRSKAKAMREACGLAAKRKGR